MGETASLVLFSGGQDSTVCLAWALRALCARRDRGLRLRPAPRGRVGAATADPLASWRPSFPVWAPRLGEDHVLELATLGAISDSALTREAEFQHDRGRTAQHLRARPQPAVLHLRCRARLPPRHPHPRRRHVRDGLLGLSRLPQRHAADPRQGHLARHGFALRDRDAADVDRQGRHLGDGPAARRRAAGRPDRRAHAHVLHRRPHDPPRLGLRLRPMPGLRLARERMGDNGRPQRPDPRRGAGDRRRMGRRAQDRAAGRGRRHLLLDPRRAAQDRGRRRQLPLLVSPRRPVLRGLSPTPRPSLPPSRPC